MPVTALTVAVADVPDPAEDGEQPHQDSTDTSALLAKGHRRGHARRSQKEQDVHPQEEENNGGQETQYRLFHDTPFADTVGYKKNYQYGSSNYYMGQ